MRRYWNFRNEPVAGDLWAALAGFHRRYRLKSGRRTCLIARMTPTANDCPTGRYACPSDLTGERPW